MKPFLLLTLFLHLALASTPQKPLKSQHQYGPSVASATENANLIFNAIYSSMRQWGSSIQHNGVSFFPAYIPEGTLLYHGHPKAERAKGPEWLAFEIPHAEMFAKGWRRKPNSTGSENGKEHTEFMDLRNAPPQQLWGLEKPHPDPIEFVPGYLHIYQTARPLKVLYLDGMAAANCDRGTLDSQDILLLNFTKGLYAERQRAQELCALGETWGVEGFIRMECGFELIKCDFEDGLDFISHKQRPDYMTLEARTVMFLLDFIRDIASRYHGIDGGRVQLDYSSMVSAFFYPANLSNPDKDPGQAALPRLVEADKNVLQRIKSDLGDAVRKSKPNGSVDWQGVADMIVKRLAPRLEWMAAGMEQEMFLSQVNMLLNTFVDYEIDGEQDPVSACSEHYLQPVQLSTEQDRLIAAAFKTVTRRICSTLFYVRGILLEKHQKNSTGIIEDVGSEVELIRDLKEWLDWSDWKACGQCKVNEVCFIAVFPFGSEEDHNNPVRIISFVSSYFGLFRETGGGYPPILCFPQIFFAFQIPFKRSNVDWIF